MKFLIRFALLMCAIVLCSPAYCQEDFVWHNDLRSKFLNNEAIIMEVNIRSFNSKDLNGDGFIQEEAGEERGTFLNAVDRLDELKLLGINTLHVLPVTPTGRRKALGTAGSLYAAADFSSINPELIDEKSELTPQEQVQKFVEEAHKRGIRLIIDVPACGSYDLYLQRPDLFVSNSAGEPILPEDWTDVRLLATGSDEKVDPNVFSVYKDFVKYFMNLGFDGIRADVAHCKTKNFWKGLIDYSRSKDPEFMWLAESSQIWKDPIAPEAVYTPYDELLEAGFDGYYGAFFNLKDWNNSKDLYNNFSSTFIDLKKFNPKKSVIGSFTTHDEVSPILQKGAAFSDMIIWLNATLPLNSYFVDGFQTGDDYIYPMGNKSALSSNTDDEIYFTHRGKIDIFNLSRKPGGEKPELRADFILGNNIKTSVLSTLNNSVFVPLKTNNSHVFAYSFADSKKGVLTIGNLDFENDIKTIVNLPNSLKNGKLLPIKISDMPQIKRGKVYLDLKAGETVVLIIK